MIVFLLALSIIGVVLAVLLGWGFIYAIFDALGKDEWFTGIFGFMLLIGDTMMLIYAIKGIIVYHEQV